MQTYVYGRLSNQSTGKQDISGKKFLETTKEHFIQKLSVTFQFKQNIWVMPPLQNLQEDLCLQTLSF